MAKPKGGKAGTKKGGPKKGGGRFKVIEGGSTEAAAKAKETAARVGEHVLISASALKSLLKEDTRIKGDIDELVSELRGEIKVAVDKKGLDKKAYAMLKAISRMTPEKGSRVYHNFLAYMDLSGVLERIDAVQDLPLETEQKQRAAEGNGAGEQDEEAGELQAGEQEFGEGAGAAPVH